MSNDSYQRAAEQREGSDAWLGDPREAEEAVEEDEHGQIRLGHEGEQRGLPGLSAGPEPAPTLDSQQISSETREQLEAGGWSQQKIDAADERRRNRG